MNKVIVLLIFFAGARNTCTHEKWNSAYQTALSIKPGATQEEVDAKLDEIHNDLSELNKQLRNELLSRSSEARQTTTNTSSTPQESRTSISYSSNSENNAANQDLTFINQTPIKAKNINRWFPKRISQRKALILGGISLGGWIAYRNTDRIAEYCSTINNKKLLKTCFYVGAGSAVLIASLYGYKKIMGTKAQSDKKAKDYCATSHAQMPTTQKRNNNTLDYSSLSNEELQALTRKNEEEITKMNTRQKNDYQAAEKRHREVKQRAETVDNQSAVSGTLSDLGDALNDVIKDPRTPAQELINDARREINNVEAKVKKVWNRFKNWLNSYLY